MRRRQKLCEQRLISKFTKHYGVTVLQGPFAGMRYLEHSFGSALLPKLMGIYELELREVIEEVCNNDYQVIVDIGCAEGYYAVGMALRCPHASVFGFDIDPKARELCSQLSTLNSVQDRLEVRGEFSGSTLLDLPPGKCLIICDCEGTEDEILDPNTSSRFEDADLLVEVHNNEVPGMTMELVRRFSSTHRIQFIDNVIRAPATIAPLWMANGRFERLIAVNESRVPMQWLWMVSKKTAEFPSS
ncbi:hypothetical protein SH528x_005488 [Novipirellula sp. SH528]|uniref:hypothetical protein n=1 Tax=Novipirellula sp. SH528 TaxID=3454466 RepID=UPI003F9EC88A